VLQQGVYDRDSVFDREVLRKNSVGWAGFQGEFIRAAMPWPIDQNEAGTRGASIQEGAKLATSRSCGVEAEDRLRRGVRRRGLLPGDAAAFEDEPLRTTHTLGHTVARRRDAHDVTEAMRGRRRGGSCSNCCSDFQGNVLLTRGWRVTGFPRTSAGEGFHGARNKKRVGNRL
jgi:hypothetical protein